MYEMNRSEFNDKYSPTTKLRDFYAIGYYEDSSYRDERAGTGGRVIWSSYRERKNVWNVTGAIFGYPVWQGYCIHYGGEGTRGGRGGIGLGGQAGNGGCGGTIEIIYEGHKVNIEAKKVVMGKMVGGRE